MKKIFLLILFFAGIITAQTYVPQKADIKNPSKYTHQAAGDSLAPMVFVVNPITGTITVTGVSTAIRQDTLKNIEQEIKERLYKLKISNFPNGNTYADIRDSFNWARSITTVIDSVRNDSLTVVRSRDTISIGGTEWSKITIRGVASTDSLEVGVGTVAPSTWIRIIGTTPYVSEKLNKTYFTKVFIKGYGYKDVIKQYQLVIEAF